MRTTKEVVFTQEEIARMEIRNFVNGGLKDVHENRLYDFDEVFNELEGRYENA